VYAGAIPAAAMFVEVRSLFDRAVETASFILDDRARAVDVAVEAMAKLHVAVRAQRRRRSYLPKGRSTSGVAGRATRTRVSAGDSHLLQRLVYVESERWEREQEQAGRVDARGMLLRYVKHLVRIGLKRNSFYVVLGVSRLLHQYSTIETMEIYSLLIQDPDRVRDDHYYRSRKKQLLEEVLARFEGFLQVESGVRGEHRIRTTAPDPDMQAFVAECLRRFTPWDTRCVVPERFDPWSAEIPALLFEGDDPDDEHPIETNRIHAAIDPDCYAHVAAALALAAPAARLALPEFRMTASRPSSPGGHGPGPGGDFGRAQERFREDAERRRQHDGRVIVVVADGVERARLDLDGSAHTRVRVPAGTELVELRGARGETLAVWLAGFETPRRGSSAEYAIRLENGWEISIRRDRPHDLADFDLDVTCHEPARPVVAEPSTGFWARVRRALGFARPRPVWATAFAVALALTALVWRPSVPIELPAESGEGVTRGGGTGVTLARVRRIYVDPLGADAAAHALREALGETLDVGGRFQRAARRSQADAVLTGTQRGDTVALALVNARGAVLWRGIRTASPGETSTATAAALVDALVAEAGKPPTASRP
jgi:hypothetical protein